MKIVQLNTTYGMADSTGRNVKELHNYFMHEGHESYVYVNKFNDEVSRLDLNVKLFSNKMDQKIHAVLSRVTGLQGYFSKKSTQRLLKELKVIRPDVVVLNVLHSNCINFEMLFSYLAEEKIVTDLVLHDCFFFTGHCCHYVDSNCTRWKDKCGNCPSMKKWNKSLFFDTSKKVLRDKKRWFSKFDSLNLNVIAVSKWMEKEIRQSILKNVNIEAIYNWVDLESFKYTDELPAKLPKQMKNHIAVAVASYWDDDKGLNDIITLSESVNDLTILVIGNSNGKFKTCNNIFEVGIVQDMKEMARYYSIADVFLNPSKQETFGKTTAEAFACGTPVVAYRTTACTELVNRERGGLAEWGNIGDFISKVRDVLNNGRMFYSMRATKFAKENFNDIKNMKAYLNFIEDAVNRKKK